MISTIISSPLRATVHSAIPRVSEFVFIQRPRSLSGLRFAATGSSKSGCRWLFCLKSNCVIWLKVFVRHRVILAQEIARTFAVVFEDVKLGQHEKALHDHCLKTSFREAEVVGTHETRAGARCRVGGEDIRRRHTPINWSVRSDGEDV